ncbi:hypothetical protein ABH975_006584 [Bradyrhizobium ottawaense]
MLSVAMIGRIHERTRPISKLLLKSLASARPSIHESLDEAVLHRLSRRDEVPVDDRVLAPGQHGVAGELGAMVGRDHSWLAASLNDFLQFAGHPPPRIDVSGMAPRYSLVTSSTVENAEAPAVGELVVDVQSQGGVAHARSIGRRRCVGSGRRQRAHAAASCAFRPARAGLPSQRRCGSGWSRSGSTARGWPPWPRSMVPTARESVLPPSPGAACAYGRPARR